ncbi:MAG: sulfotransferase, partial [Limnohabitans sp.]
MITSPYSRLDRWLHRIALQPESVRRLSFDLERQFYLPDNPQRAAQGAVYVCGLARSGTTILLRILDEIPELKSLSYRSMPFALAPNLWAAANRPMNRQVAEIRRAHGDGLLVDLDSPEALEEVFWRTFGQPIDDDTGTMGYAPPSPETMAAFADYRALVANPKGAAPAPDGKPRRYLSKNNNNLLRLDSLCADPTAHVLLVYRDPVATARSMHKQHLRFCKAQKEHPFIRRYMDWLGHFEFGLGHRPFAFARPFMDPGLRPEEANYWLDYWCNVHNQILLKQVNNLHLVNYDALCAQP